MSAPSSPDAIREVNERYHDGAAAHYDSKWGIDWGEVGLILGWSLAASFLATLPPAWRASRLDPVEALRYE